MSFANEFRLTANSCEQTSKETNRYRTRCVYHKNMWLLKDGCTLQPKHVDALRPIVKFAGGKLVCIKMFQRKLTILSELCVRASNRCFALDVEVLMEQAARGKFGDG